MSPDAESVSSSSSSSSDESGAPPPPPSSVGSSGGALRVSYTSRKSRHCTLCNAKSTDQSPLDYSEEIFPEVQGRIPWRSYEKVKMDDGEQVRVPSGKLCLICFNVYRVSLPHAYHLASGVVSSFSHSDRFPWMEAAFVSYSVVICY